MQSIYQLRRLELSREQNAIIRKLITDQRQTLSNHIVSATEVIDRKYGRSGMTGAEYIKQKLLPEYHALSPLFQIFPPDDMWQDNGERE